MNTNRFFSNKIISALLSLLCVTLWGTAFPVIKKCYEIFAISGGDYGSKILFAGERFFLAGIMVLAVGIITSKSLPYPKKQDILPITIMGFIQIFLQYLFSYIGLSNTTGTKTSVITALGPFIGVFASWVFLRDDSVTLKKIIGCVLGIAGIVFINIQDFSPGAFRPLGEGFVIISAVSAAAGSVYSKKITPGRNPSTISAYHLLIGGAGLIIAGISLGGRLEYGNVLKIFLLVYLALISGISFTLWTALLKYNPVSNILIFQLLIPIFGILWSGILLGEEIINAGNIISVALISAGIVLVNGTSRLRGGGHFADWL